MFLGAPFNKIVQIFPIRWKTWPPGGGSCFPYTCIVKTLKIFLSKSTSPIWKLFCINVPWGTLYQDCSNISDPLKNMAARGGACFRFMCIVETLKIYLSKSISPIWKLFCTNVPWGTFYQDCSNKSDPLKNMAARGGACFPYMCIVKSLKIYLSKSTCLI